MINSKRRCVVKVIIKKQRNKSHDTLSFREQLLRFNLVLLDNQRAFLPTDPSVRAA